MEEQNLQTNEQKNIEVRTMASDLNEIAGGNPPKAYNPEEKNNTQTSNTTSSPEQKIDLTSLEGNVETTKQTAETEQKEQLPKESQGTSKSKEGKNKLPLIIGIIVGVIILVALGYFVIYPLVFSSQEKNYSVSNNEYISPSSNTTTNTVGLATSTSTETSNEAVEISETETQTSTNATSSQTSTASEENVVSLEHLSPFAKVDGVVTSSLVLKGSNLSQLNLENFSTSSLIEVVFVNPNITFASIMKEVLDVDLTVSGLANAFDEKYTTGFVYIEENGSKKLGYIAKLKQSSSLVDEKASLNKIIESNVNLKNLFSEDPGSISGWKNGSGIASPHRYTLFQKQGYSLDYGWKDDIFIISTSFKGFNEAVKNLK